MEKRLISTKEAAEWASEFLGRPVTHSNIQYLIQYAKIRKYLNGGGITEVNLDELKDYYERNVVKKQKIWKKQ